MIKKSKNINTKSNRTSPVKNSAKNSHVHFIMRESIEEGGWYDAKIAAIKFKEDSGKFLLTVDPVCYDDNDKEILCSQANGFLEINYEANSFTNHFLELFRITDSSGLARVVGQKVQVKIELNEGTSRTFYNIVDIAGYDDDPEGQIDEYESQDDDDALDDDFEDDFDDYDDDEE